MGLFHINEAAPFGMIHENTFSLMPIAHPNKLSVLNNY